MPESANSRSLEDILASIRRSLADESVEGLVELSAAAVDAARAERVKPQPSDAAPVSAADALADELLREKLAGALVIETDAGGSTFSEDEAQIVEASPDSPGPAEAVSESDALAKLWVLRPGVEEAAPTAAPARSLSIDPFADAVPSQAPTVKADFNISPLELLGRAVPMATPVPSMPPLPQAPAAAVAPAAMPARAADGSGPPRLDAESIALLQKLRASNAAAIEKIAQSNVESEETSDAVDVDEVTISADVAESSSAETPSAPFAELLQSVAEKVPEPPAVSVAAEASAATVAPSAVTIVEEPAVVVEEEPPRLSLPERSTPLFGGHADARPPLTSGLDHLLPEAATIVPAEAPADVSLPEPKPEVPEPELEQEVEAADAPAAVELQAAPVDAVTDAPTLAAPEAEVELAPIVETVAAPTVEATEAETQPETPPPAQPGPNKALEDMIAAVLEPVLQRLIETNIGPALEALVRREVERVLKEQRPPE